MSPTNLMKINLSKGCLKVRKLRPSLLKHRAHNFLCVTSSYLVNSSGCTFVVNRLREMLSSSSSSSFFARGPFEVTFSERSCFLGDSEASFVPCDTDFIEPLATQEVASAHESKTALEALSLNGDLLRYVLISFITYTDMWPIYPLQIISNLWEWHK